MEYSELHDATLQSVQLQWAEGTVRLEVIYSSGGTRRRGAILGIDVSIVTCPRAFPWGKSGSINDVSTTPQGGAWVLRLEMQSGDEIEIRGSTFSLEEGASVA